MNRIVAIVGMCGSGKSRVTEYFKECGWNCIYFGGVTINELKIRNMPVNETNERAIREELRRELGPAAFAIKLEEDIKASVEKSHTVLDGLYSWQEYVKLKDAFGDDLIVLAIVTNRRLRYSRLAKREFRPLTYENAKERDYAEIEILYKGGPIAIADYYIDNNDDENTLKNKVEAFISNLGTD